MRYRTTVAGEEREFSGLDSQISDSERFRDSMPVLIRCRHCQGRFAFLPLNDPEVRIQCLLLKVKSSVS
jgi:DNA polymerase alpha subunit A